MPREDFFNFSKDEDININPNFKRADSNEEEELIGFTDNITSIIQKDNLSHVVVHIYGAKNKKMNAQEFHGGFSWNPDITNMNSFHLPIVAKESIPELQTGKEYYALIRTPNNEKIGGVYIFIKKEEADNNDVFNLGAPKNQKTDLMPIKDQSAKPINDYQGEIEQDIKNQSNVLFRFVFDHTMSIVKKSMEKMMQPESDDLSSLRKEIQTLRGVVESNNTHKFVQENQGIIEEKDKKIKDLNEQIEYIHSELATLKNGSFKKQNGLSSVMELVKGLVEVKDLIIPLAQSFGIDLGAINRQNQQNYNTGKYNSQKDELTQKINTMNIKPVDQIFTGFSAEDDDISFSAFEEVSNNKLESNNSKEISLMAYKEFSTKILTLVLSTFKTTDKVSEVLEIVKEDVTKNFWKLVKECKMDENTVLGMGLRTPNIFAEKVMEHIPTEILGIMRTNATGENYTDKIKTMLAEIVSDAAKKLIQ